MNYTKQSYYYEPIVIIIMRISVDHINHFSKKTMLVFYFILCYLCPKTNIQCVGWELVMNT
jgi:hypothetical protein